MFFFNALRSALVCLLATVLAVHAITIPGYALRARDRFFELQNGDPFFWQADTSWLLFHRLNLSEVETYLDDRASKGFNIVLVVAVTQEGPTNPNVNGDPPLIDSDPTKPNEPYWAYVDKIVQMAWNKGIRFALVPAWGNSYFFSSNNVPGIINATNAKQFGTWVGARYPGLPKILVADTNPWWTNKTAVIDNFAAGGAPPAPPFTDYGPIYDLLAEGLISGEQQAYQNLSGQRPPAMITIHPTNQWFSPGPVAVASAFFGDRDWLTFDSCQSGHTNYPPHCPIPWWNADRGYEPVSIMYANPKPRPLVDDENHYEGRYINANPDYPVWNASNVRIGNWQSVFTGASGFTYGADNVMQDYVPGVYTQDGSGPARSMFEDLNLPGASQMQYIQKVITDRRSYFTRIGDQSIIAGNPGTDEEHIAATRDSQGGYLMVYTPTGEPFIIDTSSLRGDNVHASWYDPLSGVYQGFAYSQGGGGLKTFTPPSNASHPDWCLVLEAS